MNSPKRILITGAAGYIGHLVGNELIENHIVIGCDIRSNTNAKFPIEILDIGSKELSGLMAKHKISHVIHLASVLDSSADRNRDYQIDVEGTRNVLDCAIAEEIKHITVTSSGAAYGYHADNPTWLTEQDPLRGNYEFAYSWHKRLVEEMLAEYRDKHPQLQQLVLRPGTVMGGNTRNLITNLFLKKRILTLRGADSPFVFIWDNDVVNIIHIGVSQSKTGIFNLAGDGALSLIEIAKVLKKPALTLPVPLLKIALTIGKFLRMTRYGPEQLNFLRYRPVLTNKALVEDFGYRPIKSSAEVLQLFADGINQEKAL